MARATRGRERRRGGAAVSGGVCPGRERAGEPLAWSALLWLVPPETRLNAKQVAAALARPKSFVYRLTSRNGSRLPRLPHRVLAGELSFEAAEVRAWITANETVVVPGRTVPL